MGEWGTSRWGDVFLFIHHSHATYGDHGEVMYSPFPVKVRGSKDTSGGVERKVTPPARDEKEGNPSGIYSLRTMPNSPPTVMWLLRSQRRRSPPSRYVLPLMLYCCSVRSSNTYELH